MPRGGRRAGTPGRAYSNRSDLNMVRQTQPGSVNAPVPTPPQPGPAQPAQPTMSGAPAAGPPIPQPGTLGSLMPTQRPGEPITHGLSTGPGAGPEIFAQPFSPDPVVQAAAAFQAVPAIHQTPMMRALGNFTQAAANNASNPGIAPGGGQ